MATLSGRIVERSSVAIVREGCEAAVNQRTVVVMTVGVVNLGGSHDVQGHRDAGTSTRSEALQQYRVRNDDVAHGEKRTPNDPKQVNAQVATGQSVAL